MSHFTRRTGGGSARESAEAAFKKVTAKPIEAAVAKPSLAVTPNLAGTSKSIIPGAREVVSLRLDKDVLDFFQADGPGWQDRIGKALRQAAGL